MNGPGPYYLVGVTAGHPTSFLGGLRPSTPAFPLASPSWSPVCSRSLPLDLSHNSSTFKLDESVQPRAVVSNSTATCGC